MQARSTGPPEIRPYTAAVPKKLDRKRPAQGARLVALRQAAGLSQAELARLVGTTQQSVAYWETSDRPPGSDYLPKLAKALGVRVEVLLGADLAQMPRKSGPAGKLRKMFDELAKLPRAEQDRILHVLDALVDKHRKKAS